MNLSPSYLKIAFTLFSAACVTTVATPRSRAQQPGPIFPVAAAPSLLDPLSTPSLTPDAPANVETPPAANPGATTDTEILATKGANFSSKDRVAVFEGDVRVNDARFQLACEKLTVFLAKGASGEGTTALPSGNTPPKPTGDQNPGGGGIDHAYAEGNVIIIQKRPPTKPGEEAKISKGHAERADFDNKTGDMLLRGTPSVEQNGNVHLSLSPSTTMTLHKDNSMTTVGPSRTVIKGKTDSVDLPGTAPGTSPKPGGNGKKRPRGASATSG